MRWTERLVICVAAVVIALGVVLAEPIQVWWSGRALRASQVAGTERSGVAEPTVAGRNSVDGGSMVSSTQAAPEQSAGVPTAPLTPWSPQAPQRTASAVGPSQDSSAQGSSAQDSSPPGNSAQTGSPATGDLSGRPSNTVAPAAANRGVRPTAAPAAKTPPRPTTAPVVRAPLPAGTVPGVAGRTSAAPQVSPSAEPARSLARVPGLSRPAQEGPAVTAATPPKATTLPQSPRAAVSAPAPKPQSQAQAQSQQAPQPPRRVADSTSTPQGAEIEVMVPRSPPSNPEVPGARPQPGRPDQAPPELPAEASQRPADSAPTAIDELVPDQAAAGVQALDGQIEEPTAPESGPGTSDPADARAQGRTLMALLEGGQWDELWARLSPAAQARWSSVAAFQSVWTDALGQQPRLLGEAVVEDDGGASYSRVMAGKGGHSWSVSLRLDAAGAVQDIRIAPAD